VDESLLYEADLNGHRNVGDQSTRKTPVASSQKSVRQLATGLP
jgi:hypothetical protein